MQAANLVADFLDVLGGGSAAAADDPRTGLNKARGVLRHVLGRAQIDVAAVDAGGESGVGLGAEWLTGIRSHLFQGLEHHLGSGGAVEPDHVHRHRVQRAREVLDGRSVLQTAVVFDAQVRHDDHFGSGGLACRFHGGANFVQVSKRLEHQAVDAGFDQGVDLLAEDGTGFVDGGGTERLQANAQRSDGGPHKGLISGGLAGDSYTGLIDEPDLVREAEGRQTLAVRAERIGLDDLGPGADVFLVDVAHQGGEREVQLVITAVDEGAFGIEHGAHGAVRHPYALAKGLPELGGPGRCRSHWHVCSLRNALSSDKAFMNASSETDWTVPNDIVRSDPALARIASSSVPAGAPVRLRRPPAKPEESV